MEGIEAAIDGYLTRDAAALAGFDAEAAADLWVAPGMIVDDQFVAAVDSREAMIDALEQSYPLYQQLGLASVRYELLRQERLTDAVTLVLVRWLFFDAGGDQLTDSTSYYIVRRDDAGLRACVCIQVDALEKLQALAAQRGVDLAPPPS